MSFSQPLSCPSTIIRMLGICIGRRVVTPKSSKPFLFKATRADLGVRGDSRPQLGPAHPVVSELLARDMVFYRIVRHPVIDTLSVLSTHLLVSSAAPLTGHHPISCRASSISSNGSLMQELGPKGTESWIFCLGFLAKSPSGQCCLTAHRFRRTSRSLAMSLDFFSSVDVNLSDHEDGDFTTTALLFLASFMI